MLRTVPAYRALMLELERRRQQLGWTMSELDDFAGLNDGHFGHLLHADRPSGRQGRWEIVQLLISALFPDGFDLTLTPKRGEVLTAQALARKIKVAGADRDRLGRRALMRALASRGGRARAQKYKTMSKEERERIAKKARKTRRKNRLLRARLKKEKPETQPVRSAAQPTVIA